MIAHNLLFTLLLRKLLFHFISSLYNNNIHAYKIRSSLGREAQLRQNELKKVDSCFTTSFSAFTFQYIYLYHYLK